MMSNKLDNFEIVCEGWLTKSPPTTRIWRARWRRRWFILRHSGELPGQYFLCYYTDRNCRKLKGQIDLDQCEQVDAGLRFEGRKQKYHHMFLIRTPKRIYYLAADSEDDMNRWVDCVCHVCGLKPYISDDTVTEYDGDDISETTTGVTDLSPPVTPSTIISSPYIPISQCISGKPIKSEEDLKEFLLIHGNTNKNSVMSSQSAQITFPQSSPAFESTTITLTSPSLIIGDFRPDSYDLPRKLKPPEIKVDDDNDSTPPSSPELESVFADSDPMQQQQPSMLLQKSQNASMTVTSKKPTVNWETFPQSPPSPPPRPPKPSHLSVYEITPSSLSQQAETIEPTTPGKTEITQDEMYDIPRSHQILPSEQEAKKIMMINRHCYMNAAPSYPPNIDRKLKPTQLKKMIDVPQYNESTLSRNHKQKSKKFNDIQYLDLDLNSTDSGNTFGSAGLVKKSSENLHTPATATVYKTVDFLKTEAFNRSRTDIEDDRCNRLRVATAEPAL